MRSPPKCRCRISAFSRHSRLHQIGRAVRIKDAIRLFAAMPRQIDRQALVARLPEQVADRDQVGLHSAVRRRVRSELHHFHTSSATGAPSLADSIIARQPSVARAPSRTVTAGARPRRMRSAKSSICA